LIALKENKKTLPMGYTADITGFPYWKNTLVKVERNSWDKVARDLMKVADQRTELQKSVGKTEDWLDKEMLKNEKLKKDMKSLKKENKFYLKKIEKVRKKMKELEEESKVDKEFQEEVVQENKKLKEENKKLKECVKRAQGDTSIFTATLYETKLKKEIIQLKEDLLYYRFYTYTLDRSGDCDLTKEDVDYFTDDEALRKTLYERIGYEEEEDYKSFGVMFVEKEDEDEDDIDFFDTEEEAQKLMDDIISSNKTSPHPYPEGKLILFRSDTYNPYYDNENTVPIVKEMTLNN